MWYDSVSRKCQELVHPQREQTGVVATGCGEERTGCCFVGARASIGVRIFGPR